MPPTPDLPPALVDRRGADPVAADAVAADRLAADQGWLRAAAQARALSWFSLAWMSGEGVLGLVAGAAADSIALLGWALGSVIEGLASIVVIWRLSGSRALSCSAEARAQKAVAVSFFLLAPYLAAASLRAVLDRSEPAASPLGMAVTAASLLVMPALGITKRRLGSRLHSGATRGEGLQNLICAGQAGAVLLGLAGNAALGWWWLDPGIGLLLAGWAVREGVGAWRGEDCC